LSLVRAPPQLATLTVDAVEIEVGDDARGMLRGPGVVCARAVASARRKSRRKVCFFTTSPERR
jgi:hypothetical protein